MIGSELQLHSRDYCSISTYRGTYCFLTSSSSVHFTFCRADIETCGFCARHRERERLAIKCTRSKVFPRR